MTARASTNESSGPALVARFLGGNGTAAVTIAAGPNGASPHPEISDRVIGSGDTVVVDIGGTTEAGYCFGLNVDLQPGEPAPEVSGYYSVLLRAQRAWPCCRSDLATDAPATRTRLARSSQGR
ncbi:MAG: M24 family metallopeptidase [Dermatophilaceae bacterium]|nr:M24 family metallopeptidase [Dermatophilaceae bacterium]